MSAARRILVADDDLDLRSGVVELLGGLGSQGRGAGLEILQAETGTEALTILRHNGVHLALLDVHMPGGTGLEILTFVRRETLRVPCILLSGDLTDGIRAQALRDGAFAVLPKPYEPARLLSEVRRALALAPDAA